MDISKAEPTRIRACIFDMDGLLIDSEDLYTEVTNTILRKYGKPDLPWNIKAQLQGRPGIVASKLFFDWAQLPCSNEEYLAEQAQLQASIFPNTQLLPGVAELFRTLAERTDVEIALATSSIKRNFLLKTKHLPELFETYFGPETGNVVVLGDDPRVTQGRGKPRGDIYLLALRLLNESRRQRFQKKGEDSGPDIKPHECLVFEDSVPGVEAGRRAGMHVAWIPHPMLAREYGGREPDVLAGRTYESGIPEEAEEARAAGLDFRGPGGGGWPSTVGDGWGRQTTSLVDFPYEKFGISLLGSNLVTNGKPVEELKN